MEALMGPFYGLLCATDPYMELCPHVCYFRQIVDKEMLISEQLVLFLAFCTLPPTVPQTMPKVLIWTSTPKLFSLMDILAIWDFSDF